MKRVKQIILFCILLLLALPAIQQYTGIFPEKPLKGAITEPVKPKLTLKSWFDDSFQQTYDDYLEQSIGFRPFLIRVNNQIAYSLLDTALANGVVIGKKNCLYEINYIRAYEGMDFVGEDLINGQVAKAKWIQDKLTAENKHFMVVFAPGKGSFFPEYIPDKYRQRKPGHEVKTNYDFYAKAFRKSGVNFLDFNRWFVQMKDTSRYPLYSKTGIHWSLYGVALAVDSLVKYMEKTATIDMVDFGWDGIELSDKPRDTDNDIANGMNLLFPIRTGTMAYPKLRFTDKPGQVKPNVIVVGDSYYWNIMGSGISARLFGDNNFWFYYREAHNPNYKEPKQISTLNILDEIRKQDFIIVMLTDANLFKFPFGFFDDVEKALKEPVHDTVISPEEKEKRVKEIMVSIRTDKQWSEVIRQKAIKKNITFEEMLRIDANWIFEQNKSK